VLTGRGSSSAPLAEPKSTDAVNAVIMAQHQPAVGLEEDNISTWRCWCSSEQAASCNPLNLEPELQTWNLWLNARKDAWPRHRLSCKRCCLPCSFLPPVSVDCFASNAVVYSLSCGLWRPDQHHMPSKVVLVQQ
jgi:hypothetical protein